LDILYVSCTISVVYEHLVAVLEIQLEI
jgi:hypothetical protein